MFGFFDLRHGEFAVLRDPERAMKAAFMGWFNVYGHFSLTA
jgi:hypothetical protein